MQPETHPITELIAKRTAQLRLLAAQLTESRQALVRLDLDAIHRHNAQQQMLYQEVQRLDGEIGRFASPGSAADRGSTLSLDAMASDWDDEAKGRLRALLREHDVARQRVQELSQVQAELLRRSRRYLHILFNLVNNSMGLYEAPRPQPALWGAAGRGN
jgi:hypothetical protein